MPLNIKTSRPKRDVLADAESMSTPPDALPANHVIARVLKGEGYHLWRVQTADEQKLLVELPARLRNVFWIKNGGYVVVDTEALQERENKVNGEIQTVIMQEKDWRKKAYWPKKFPDRNAHEEDSSEEESNVGKMPPSDSENDEG